MLCGIGYAYGLGDRLGAGGHASRLRRAGSGSTKVGMPGGATHDGESPEAAAHREATEEIRPVPAYRVTSIEVQDCGGGWKFHIVHADIDEPFTAYTYKETASTGWFTISQMKALRLHPGFRQ
jgi:8-oxo-dGTP diphosphatase